MRSKEVRQNEQRNNLKRLKEEPFSVQETRKYSIDSVHEEVFRVEVCKLIEKTDELTNFAKFESWIPIEDDENEGWISELPFEIPYEKVREGMVFVVSNDKVIEITDLVREESKELYSKMLVREYNVLIRRQIK